MVHRTATQRRTSLAQRALLWVVIVALASATGLFWAGQRQARAVDATVRLTATAVLTADGTLEVEEELVVVAAGRRAIQRVIPVHDGVRWVGITGEGEEAISATRVSVAEGLQVTVPLDGEPEVLRLRYDLLGVGRPAMDGVELAWPVLDDRNPLALAGMVLDVTWEDDGEPAAVELEAPGTATTVLPRPAGLRIDTGPQPAHHLVELHAALPRSAVTEVAPEDRSVMDAMDAVADGAGAGDAADRTGGGPWWLPVAVAVGVLLGWVAVQRRHGQQPDPDEVVVTEPPGSEPPAEVAWLLRNGVVRERDIGVTVVDLVSRGIIEVGTDRWVLHAGPEERQALAPHEAVLVGWLFHDTPTCQPHQLVDRVTADPGEWRLLRRRFVEAVEAEGRQDGLLERTVDAESIVGIGVAGGAVVVAGVIGTALGQPLWLVCVTVGALVVTSLDAFARRSPEGARRAAAWLAFGDHLEGATVVPPQHRAIGMVLQVPAAYDDTARRAADVVDELAHAYVAATSYLAPPRRRTRTAVG